MGGQLTKLPNVNFEDVKWIIKNKENHAILINTLDKHNQECLIKNTVICDKEEKIINDYMKHGNITIIIYGENTNDETVTKKYNQLVTLGFSKIYIYSGGLFEWLCLQDIYGAEEFPTTSKQLDILKYKPKARFHNNYLENKN